MAEKLLYISLVFVLSGCLSLEPAAEPVPEPVVRTARLIFIGDVMSHSPQVAAAYIPKTDSTPARYDYTRVFRHVRPIFDEADVVIANLETTLRTSPPYTGYPTFAAPAELAFAMREAGVDIALTANNHICDKGAAGIRSTLALLDSAGLRHTGAFADSVASPGFRARNPLRFTTGEGGGGGGLRFALLNYTYGTNGIPVPKGFIVNSIDTAAIARDLAVARDHETDCVIVCYHWGEEYLSQPTRRQKALAAWTRARGADIVIGGHPHVVEPMEAHYNDDSTAVTGATYYSLGNFVSNQRRRRTDGGMMAEVTVTKTDSLPLRYELGYRLVWVHTPYEGGHRRYEVLPADIADSLPADTPARAAADLFFRDTRKLLSTAGAVFHENR